MYTGAIRFRKLGGTDADWINGWFNGIAVAYSDLPGVPELSVQQDGSFQTRPAGTAAANPNGWEVCKPHPSGPFLIYSGTGINYAVEYCGRV